MKFIIRRKSDKIYTPINNKISDTSYIEETKIVEKEVNIVKDKKTTTKKQNNKKNSEVMKLNEDTINKLDSIIDTNSIENDNQQVEDSIVVKKERGLIERANSSKKILIEGDNRELLRD